MLDSNGFGDSTDAATDEPQGSLRGHLNDGTLNYAGVTKPLSELSFGLCKINYRNTGSVLKIQIAYISGTLKVRYNDLTCFETDRVSLPKDQYFGISASSTENADSFIVNSFHIFPVPTKDNSQQIPTQSPEQTPEQIPGQVPEQVPAGQVPVQEHDSKISEHLVKVLEKIESLESSVHKRLDTLEADSNGLKDLLSVKSSIPEIEARLAALDSSLKQFVQTFLQSTDGKHMEQQQIFSRELDKINRRLEDVNKAVIDHTSNLGVFTGTVDSALKGGLSGWKILGLFVVAQLIAYTGYAIYKYRIRRDHEKIL